MKQQLELYVERVHDTDSGLQKLALESMRLILFNLLQLLCHFVSGFFYFSFMFNRMYVVGRKFGRLQVL